MNINLALDTLGKTDFETVLDGIRKIKDENKELIRRNKKCMNRFDECIELLGCHSELNKELRKKGIKQNGAIKMLKEENKSLVIIIDDLTILNKDLQKENKLLWDEKETQCSGTTEGMSECGCCHNECDCSCNCDCHEDAKQETLYKNLAEKEEKIKMFLTEIEKLKCENKELKKKQVFVFRSPPID